MRYEGEDKHLLNEVEVKYVYGSYLSCGPYDQVIRRRFSARADIFVLQSYVLGSESWVLGSESWVSVKEMVSDTFN
jgi:hypothetical protein